MQQTRPLLGIGLMVLATLCFAALDATSKTLSQIFPVPFLTWARYLVHFLLMLAFLAPSMKARLLLTQRPALQIWRAVMLVGTTGFAMASMRIMPLAEATSMLFVTPLTVALLAGPLLGERIGAARLAAVIAGFCGMLLVARPGGAMTAEGIAWALAAATCFTVYQIQTRMLSPSENTWTMLFYTALVGTAVMSAGLPLFWTGDLPSLSQATMIASLGIYGGTGHFLLIRAFRFAPASTLSPFLYVQLVWAGLFGFLFYDHVPDRFAVAGMAVIAASSIAMAAFERRAR